MVVRLPKDLHRRVKVTAAQRDLTLQSLVERALLDYLDSPAVH